MDGNGRWAKKRGLPRIKGHEQGAETVREITTFCANHPEIKVLTLYAFSTENWKRPKPEVEFLTRLLERYLKNELPVYMKEGVRFETIGDLKPFGEKLKKRINETKEATKNNKKLIQVLALNYGGRDEIVRAANKACQRGVELKESNFDDFLDVPGLGDVDILVRTGGEMRLSNFLLWRSAYAELFFTNTLWPDFSPKEMEEIIYEFYKRERRFGGI
ncbi:polyprenyl diphosphate synthase [Nitrosophilus alvini]|uniref:polyprenyl diphosphate synthase n=1 Tax=Nitrosophilus alvini TaxID=2714855 RepID=UPI00190D2D78